MLRTTSFFSSVVEIIKRKWAEYIAAEQAANQRDPERWREMMRP